jgi:hypothetical protein
MRRLDRYSKKRRGEFRAHRKHLNRRFRTRKVYLAKLSAVIRQLPGALRVPSSSRLLETVTRILDEDDPCNIIHMCGQAGFGGQTAGEYAPEAEAILLRLNEWESVERLQFVIQEVFDDLFYYPDVAPERYGLAAHHIWNAWASLCGNAPLPLSEPIVLPPRKEAVLIRLE